MLIIYATFFFFFKINSSRIINNTNNTALNNVGSGVLYSYINLYIYVLVYNCIYILTIKGSGCILWFNHITLNNLVVFLLYFFAVVGFLFYFLIKQVSKKKKIIKSVDFLLSVSSLIFLLPYLFCVSTIFTLLFFLELLSTILFYKLLSSKIWFKKTGGYGTLENNIPQNYINMVFFQYWVTFFSTIFIIYFYINMYSIFGTSDWSSIQYYYTYIFKNKFLNINTDILLILFVFSIFIKLGIAPLHLFKVEVYNGLPYITIFFYTTFYFLVFFLFFINFLLNFLGFFLQQVYLFFFIFIFFGISYVTVLLFDVSFIKTFFAYSTIINCMGFLAVFISSL